MLTEIRDRSSGWFAWVIAALIIIPMAFWGVQEYATVEANPALVEFADQKITKNDFDARLNTEQQRVREQMGENVNNEFLTSDSFKQSVLQRMVSSALVEQVAADQNYRVSDAQLAAQIKQSEMFQLDGEFNKEAYDRFLVSSQYSKTRYEDALRKDLVVQQVTGGFQESAIVLPNDVRELLEIQAERRTFDLASIRKQDYLENVEVSEQEIETYYNENPAQFMEPEKMSVEYVELDLDQIAEEITVSEDELESIFEQNKESYLSSAKRETRHILLSTNSDQDEETQLIKAQSLVEQLRAGADFAELAEENSDDTGSALRGGDLGLVEPGQMVPEFEAAAFALEKDAISDPVKSQFGYHIIQVTDIQVPEQQEFADVRLELLDQEKTRQAEEILIEKSDQLRDLAFEQPGNLDTAAEVLGVELRTSDLFSRGAGDGIAAFATVRNAAFAEDVFVEELNSEPIEVSNSQVIALRKKEVVAAAPQPLDQVKAQITGILQEQKARELAAETGAELLAKAELNWQNVLDEEGVETATHTVSLIDQSRVISPEILQEVTRLNLGNGDPVISSLTDRNGDFHIVRLRTVQPGNIAEISEQIKESTRQVLAQRNGRSIVNTYIDSLNDLYAPEINSDLL